MTRNICFVVLFGVMLSGCYDEFYLPKIRNGLNAEVEVTVVYSDGSRSASVWAPCKEVFVGVPEDSAKQLAAIEIRRESELIRRYDEREIVDLIKEQEAHSGYSAWVIRQNGVSLETSPSSSCE